MYKKSKPLVGISTAVFIGHKLHRLQDLVYTVFEKTHRFLSRLTPSKMNRFKKIVHSVARKFDVINFWIVNHVWWMSSHCLGKCRITIAGAEFPQNSVPNTIKICSANKVVQNEIGFETLHLSLSINKVRL